MAFCSGYSGKKPNLIITGASGMLGDALCRLARSHWSVFGIYREHRLDIADVLPVEVDLTVASEVADLVRKIRPRAIVHAAANSQVTVCEANPQQTEAINVEVPALLADICVREHIDYLFTSTDLVFDGLAAPYDEQGTVNPMCVYGRQKAAAEKAVLRCYPGALVCRLPLMFGLAPHAMRHFTVQILRAIRTGQPIQLLVDEYRSPVDSHSAARGILGLLGKAHGIVHLGGRSRVSRFEMGFLMADYLKTTPTMIQPTTIAALDVGVVRAPDCTMDSALAYDMGYAPTPLWEALQRVAVHFNEI